MHYLDIVRVINFIYPHVRFVKLWPSIAAEPSPHLHLIGILCALRDPLHRVYEW